MSTINDEVDAERKHDERVKREKGIFKLFQAALPTYIELYNPMGDAAKKDTVDTALRIAEIAYDKFDEAFGVAPLQLD